MKTNPDPDKNKLRIKGEKPISPVYPVIDTDLGRDNVENDIPAADLEDLWLTHEAQAAGSSPPPAFNFSKGSTFMRSKIYNGILKF